jgi:ribosomal protein S18 acetylase RimI-like enzyme
MREVTWDDKPHILELLCEAFDTNPSVNEVVRQDKRRDIRILLLMNYAFNLCAAFGRIWLSDDGKACALGLCSEKRRLTLWTIAADIRLAFSCIGIWRSFKIMRREARIRRWYPAQPVLHLWFLGVKPEDQHKGLGGNLLKEIVKECEAARRPIYLETSVPENLSFYRKYGFRQFHYIDFKHRLYLLHLFFEPGVY